MTESLYSARKINIRNLKASSNVEEKSSKKYVDMSSELYSDSSKRDNLKQDKNRDENHFSVNNLFATRLLKNSSMSINENLNQSLSKKPQRSQTIDLLGNLDENKVSKETISTIETNSENSSLYVSTFNETTNSENNQDTNVSGQTKNQVETILEEIQES